jgi:type II secretory pathway component PulF
MQAKSGPTAVRPLAGHLADSMKDGNSFADSLKDHRAKFPKLFVEMVTVGESAGKLPEVFEELERYFEAQQAARRQFLQAMVWPGMTYVAAVVVVAILVTVLAMLGNQLDPFKLGKLGPAGGLVVLALGFGFAGAMAFLYLIARDNDGLKQKMEAVWIQLPAVGGAFRAFALQRFSLALSMTHEAGMRADKAMFSSFQATSNDAYIRHADPTAKVVREGKKMAKALKGVGGTLFPDEFIDQVKIGEESGQVTEVMGRAAERYREDGIRHTKMLAMIAGGVVYALVALMVIALIFSIVLSIAGIYQDAMKGL